MTLLGPYLIACALLVIAGISKALHPRGTITVLLQLSPTLPTRVVQRGVPIFALAEATLGLAAAIFPVSELAAAVAASYVAFAVFVTYLRARVGASADCGCISPGTTSTRMHAIVNVAMAVSAGSVAAAGSSRWLFPLLAHQVLDGVPLIAGCAACSWLVVLILSALPRLSEERERLEQRSSGQESSASWPSRTSSATSSGVGSS